MSTSTWNTLKSSLSVRVTGHPNWVALYLGEGLTRFKWFSALALGVLLVQAAALNRSASQYFSQAAAALATTPQRVVCCTISVAVLGMFLVLMIGRNGLSVPRAKYLLWVGTSTLASAEALLLGFSHVHPARVATFDVTLLMIAAFTPLSLTSAMIITTGAIGLALVVASLTGDTLALQIEGFMFLLHPLSYAAIGVLFNRWYWVTFRRQRLAQRRLERHERHIARLVNQLEKADRARTRSLAAASHDVRQPMHALTLYMDDLHGQVQDPATRETVVKMERSLGAVSDLLNAFDFSRLAIGSITPVIAALSVHELFAKVEAEMRPMAREKALQLTFARTTLWADSDKVLLERILRNLVANAVRYTVTGKVHVRARAKSSGIELQVFDTGPGIAKDQRTRIFEDYYQVEYAGRERGKGLGLGLAIVHELASLLRIPIRVTSVLGKGSVFTVTVPDANRKSTQVGERQHEGRDFVRGALVVLIHGDRSAREKVADTLRHVGCRVVEAASGTEAIVRLQGEEFLPQAIVAACRLPAQETGMAAIELVRENQKALVGDEFPLPGLLLLEASEETEREVASGAAWPGIHEPLAPGLLYKALNDAIAKAQQHEQD